MEKKEILNSLIEHYAEGNKARFAAKLGITPQAVSTWLARNTFDIDKIFANCEDVSAEWLLTGKGEMRQSNIAVIKKQESIEDKLLSVIQSKDDVIRKQAEKIGRLETEIEHLKGEREYGRPDAEVAGVAGVG